MERDFTQAALEELLTNIEETGEPIKNDTLDSPTTSYAQQVADETQPSITEAINQVFELMESNKTAAARITKVWETVGEIDSGYGMQFAALRDCLIEYKNAVFEIARMIEVGRVVGGFGLGSKPSDFSADISAMHERLKAKDTAYKEAKITYAMDVAGIPDANRAEVRAGLQNLEDNFGYTLEQQLVLVSAAKTPSEQEQLYHLLKGEYYEIFDIDPALVSPEMMQVLSDHATILAMGNYIQELEDYVNSIVSVKAFDDGFYPDRVNGNYAQTYLANMSVAMENFYHTVNSTVAAGIQSINADGTIVWKEPAEFYSSMGIKADRLTSLASLWQQLLFLNATMDRNTQELVNRGYIGQEGGDFVGFTVEGLNFTDNGRVEYDWNYQFAEYLGYFEENPNNGDNLDGKWTIRNMDWFTPEVSASIKQTSREIVISHYYEELAEIDAAREAAKAKLVSDYVSLGVSLASFATAGSMKEAGAAAVTAVKTAFILLQLAIKYAESHDISTKDAISVIQPGISNASPEASNIAGMAAGLIDMEISYKEKMEALDDKEAHTNQGMMDLWFGQMTRMKLGGTGDDFQHSGAWYAGEPYPQESQYVYFSTPGVNYRVQYGMDQWLHRGAEFLITETSDTPISANDIYGYNPDSVLGRMLNDTAGSDLTQSSSTQEWQDAINNRFNDEEKLVLFGNDPAVLKSHGIELDTEDIDFTNLDTEKFTDATTSLSSAFEEALGVHSNKSSPLAMFEEAVGLNDSGLNS